MKAVAYVDGSFNASTKTYGSGVVLFIGDSQKPITASHADNHPAFVSARNVAGEVFATIIAMEACKKIPDLEELTVYYDYAGIECWAKGIWRTNTELSQYYVAYVKELPYKVAFRKVKAHSGVTWNEQADLLAKRACGLA